MTNNGRRTTSVTCYSGHTYAERPVAFVWDGRHYSVERILKQWRTPDGPCFRVRTAGGVEFDLAYHETQDAWSLTTSASRAG